MFPFGWSAGEKQPEPKTYKDFQAIPVSVREDALTWLHGRTDRNEILMAVVQMNKAANEPYKDDIGPLVCHYEYVMMLYCWVENGRDEVQAKLAYIPGRTYGK